MRVVQITEEKMNTEKAIEIIRTFDTSNSEDNIEAKLIAIEALKKQIPKKIKIWNGQATCPRCKKLYGDMEVIKNLIAWEMPHCKYCGQAIDWSKIIE